MRRQLRETLPGLVVAAEYAVFYAGLLLLALVSLLWAPFCRARYYWLLPAGLGRRFGRFVIMCIFRFYLWALEGMGACRFDLRELDSLRRAALRAGGEPPWLAGCLAGVVAAARGGLHRNADVVTILPRVRLPGLARYIRNDTLAGMIRCAVQELRAWRPGAGIPGRHAHHPPSGRRLQGRRRADCQACGRVGADAVYRDRFAVPRSRAGRFSQARYAGSLSRPAGPALRCARQRARFRRPSWRNTDEAELSRPGK
ncbi:hypothetical protein ACU4GD_10815 [Cupriavidus basilensis]